MLHLLDCTLARWTPQLGDPTLLGWALTLGYGLAGWACLRATPCAPRFFRVLGLVMLVLMLNKQLDLHVAATALGRCAAQAQGWFGARRSVQLVVSVSGLAAGLLALIWWLWPLRAHLSGLWRGMAGLLVLSLYVALRGAGLFHLDDALGVDITPGAMLLSLEITGIALITWAGLRR